MPIQEYTVRQQAGLWEVRLGDRLLSGQLTQRAALNVAEKLARARSLRGERWKILIGDDDDDLVENRIRPRSR
jgi:hypothetical protein